MFYLNDGNRQLTGCVPPHEDELVYLFKPETDQRFPLLGQMDHTDPTCLAPEHMPQFMAELEMVRTETELNACWVREEASLIADIARSERSLVRYAHAMSSIGGEDRLRVLKERLEQMQRGELPGQSTQAVGAHVDEILVLAKACRSDPNSSLDHNPYGTPPDTFLP